MPRKKHAFLAKDLTPEERKKAFIKEYPDYANWPFWNASGMPSPDPAELARFTEPAYDFDEGED